MEALDNQWNQYAQGCVPCLVTSHSTSCLLWLVSGRVPDLHSLRDGDAFFKRVLLSVGYYCSLANVVNRGACVSLRWTDHVMKGRLYWA